MRMRNLLPQIPEASAYSSFRAFTLVETLIAIAIIMVAVTGPYAAVEHSITAVRIAQEKTTATFLAQEGIEAVRALRDKVYLHDCFAQGASCTGPTAWWNNVFVSSNTSSVMYSILYCTSSQPCVLDTSFSTFFWYYTASPPVHFNRLIPQRNTSARQLHLVDLSPFGNYYQLIVPFGPITSFTRTIYAKYNPSFSDEVEIVCTVTWKDNGTSYTVTAKDYLKPWYNE